MRRQERRNIRRCVVFNCFDSAALFKLEEIVICDYLNEYKLRIKSIEYLFYSNHLEPLLKSNG